MKRLGMSLAAISMLAWLSATAQDKKNEETKNVNVDVTVGQKSGTRESMTVIQPRPGGGAAIMTQEEVRSGEKKEAPASAGATAPVATEEKPRKARVVVIPAVFAQGIRNKAQRELNERFGLSDPTILENPGFTSYLVGSLVNLRKLDVLEREDLRSVIKEINFGESEYADVGKAVKIGQMLNADYVVIPEIRTFVVDRRQEQVPYVGQSQVKVKGRFSTTVRTVSVASSKIVSAFMDDADATSRIRERDIPSVVVSDLIAQMFADAGLRSASSVVDAAYPVKIVSVSGDQAIINRGRGAVLEGETFKVFNPGEVMVDPDTHDNLGYSEAYVATIKVTSVDEKTAKAVVTDRKGDIVKLSVCRREKAPTTAKNLTAPQQPAPTLE